MHREVGGKRHHKDLQVCRQVFDALSYALAELADPLRGVARELRGEVAAELCRRRVPELVFRIDTSALTLEE